MGWAGWSRFGLLLSCVGDASSFGSSSKASPLRPVPSIPAGSSGPRSWRFGVILRSSGGWAATDGPAGRPPSRRTPCQAPEQPPPTPTRKCHAPGPAPAGGRLRHAVCGCGAGRRRRRPGPEREEGGPLPAPGRGSGYRPEDVPGHLPRRALLQRPLGTKSCAGARRSASSSAHQADRARFMNTWHAAPWMCESVMAEGA